MQALFLQLCDSESEPSILVSYSEARMQYLTIPLPFLKLHFFTNL